MQARIDKVKRLREQADTLRYQLAELQEEISEEEQAIKEGYPRRKEVYNIEDDEPPFPTRLVFSGHRESAGAYEPPIHRVNDSAAAYPYERMSEYDPKDPRKFQNLKKFMKTYKERIQNYFVLYSPRYADNPLRVPISGSGVPTLTKEQRKEYNIPPGSVFGMARAGDKKPIYRIRLYGQPLTSELTGLSVRDLEFDDPRDAAEVYSLLNAWYIEFLDRNES